MPNSKAGQPVSVVRLDSYLQSVGQIAYAKFDTAGLECAALRGGTALLEPVHRPRYIQTEVWVRSGLNN